MDTKLLRLLESDCTLTREQLASMADMTVEEVDAAVKEYEAKKIVLGYKAIVDWDRPGTAPTGRASPPSLRSR